MSTAPLHPRQGLVRRSATRSLSFIVCLVAAFGLSDSIAWAQDATSGSGSEPTAIPDESTSTAESSADDEAAVSGAQWFASLLERTTEPLPAVEIAAVDGFFTATLPAKPLGPVELSEGAHRVSFDFGAGVDSPGECVIYRQELDLAGSLLSLSNAAFDLIEQQVGAIESKALYRLDAGGIGPMPYMGLTWIYRASTSEGTELLAGQARHWMAIKEGRALYCRTTAIGYDDAFFEVFRSMVATLAVQQQLVPEPFFESLALIEVGGQVVGVDRTTMVIDEDGDIATRETRAMLLPVDQERVQATDSALAQFSTLDGRLIAKVEVRAVNGATISQVALNRRPAGGHWQVHGTIRGQAVSHDLGTADLRSNYGQRLDFRRFVQGAEPGTTLTFRDWVPEVDAGSLLDYRLTYEEPHEMGARLTTEAGDSTVSVIVDEAFSFLATAEPLGGQKMTTQRVVTQGDVFAPVTEASGADGR